MEDQQDWLEQLQDAVNAKAGVLESKEMARLKELFGIYQTYFENIYNILIKKSVIQEDPYKYDEKISEVSTPSDAEFLDSERQDQMGQRLSSYHSQLDFLNTYYQFSVDFLDLGRIKRILSLIGYVNWARLNDVKANIVSKTLDDFINRVKMGTDNLSSQILADALVQLEKRTAEMKQILKEMTAFHRESYKLELRKNVLPNIKLQNAGLENGVKSIKQAFAKHLEGVPFYTELAQEVVNEELSATASELKDNVLKKLAVKDDAPKKKSKQKSFKELLLQAIRFMAAAGFQLEDVINKLTDNHIALSSRKLSFGEKVGRMFKRFSGGSADNQVYEIEYFDVDNSSTKTESIQYGTFLEDLRKKARMYSSLTVRSSPAVRKLMAASEDRIYEFLNRHLGALQALQRRLIGLNDFFKSEMPTDVSSKYRGLKVELSAIKNSILKSNQAKHEYTAAKEEQEQMKRLGIKLEDC